MCSLVGLVPFSCSFDGLCSVCFEGWFLKLGSGPQ